MTIPKTIFTTQFIPYLFMFNLNPGFQKVPKIKYQVVLPNALPTSGRNPQKSRKFQREEGTYIDRSGHPHLSTPNRSSAWRAAPLESGTPTLYHPPRNKCKILCWMAPSFRLYITQNTLFWLTADPL